MNVAYVPTQTLPPMEVIILPANKDLVKKEKKKGRLKVCAYCRVSTDDEEQLTSYEAQIGYYTEKIQSNPEWQFVEVFADEGKFKRRIYYEHRQNFSGSNSKGLCTKG